MADPVVVLPNRVVGKARSQIPESAGIKGQQIPKDNLFDPNWQVTDVRAVSDSTETLRQLFHTDGLVSSVIISMVQMAAAPHKIYSYDTSTTQFSLAGQLAAESLLASWDTVYDYTKGYSERKDLHTLIQVGLLEAALSGGLGGELVLSKDRYPERMQWFPYESILWKGTGDGRKYPTQRAASPKPGETGEIELNLPTVWVGEVLKTAKLTYNTPFMASGFKRLFHYDEFIEDMRRVVRASGSPRIVTTLNYQKVLQAAPADTASDHAKLSAYLEDVRTQVETILKDLHPEDALVVYDIAEVDSIQTTGEKADYKNLLDAMSGLAASALKANPSILGLRIGGSQNVASTESLLFSKVAAALQGPVQTVLSRALTMGIRLMGIDAYVKFKFEGIELRPEMELQAHRSMKQNRVLELLSLGFYGDEEAAVELGTGARPPGAPRLSGTMFYGSKAPSKLPTPNSDPNGRQMASDTATSSGGKDQAQRN